VLFVIDNSRLLRIWIMSVKIMRRVVEGSQTAVKASLICLQVTNFLATVQTKSIRCSYSHEDTLVDFTGTT
jgi:hypothetical protein